MPSIFRVITAPFIPFKRSALNVGVLLLIGILLMWIGADVIYGEYSGVVKNTMVIYFFLYLLARVGLMSKSPVMFDKREGWDNFLLMFIVTSALLIFLGGLLSLTGAIAGEISMASALQTNFLAALGFGFLHAFVKAYIEEDVFRDALAIRAGLGDIFSSILFGIFHLFVLIGVMGLTPLQAVFPIVTLIALGLIWCKVRNEFGIMGSTGSHFAWNMFALGVLPIIFMGGVA